MADQIQTPETGGGEAAAAVSPATQPAEVKSEAPVEQNAPVPAETKQVESQATTEVKPDEPKEVKPEELKQVKPELETEQVTPQTDQRPEVVPAVENKIETTAEESKQTGHVKVEANGVAESNTTPKEQGDWQQRESELLKKIEALEKVTKERAQGSVLLELKVREEEIDLLKARVRNLETELQAALSKPSGKNHEMIENIKQQHEELLSKARGMIFDKTKMVKNQELQIEALNTQIVSLKDINQITKDLLEIRNSEIKAMEDRLQAMEARFKAEKERYGLVLKRAQTSSNINDDLRKEYETQLVLFKELREKYDQRVKALVAENERLKGSVTPGPANGAGAGTSS